MLTNHQVQKLVAGCTCLVWLDNSGGADTGSGGQTFVLWSDISSECPDFFTTSPVFSSGCPKLARHCYTYKWNVSRAFIHN